jgi:hypothetical protein
MAWIDRNGKRYYYRSKRINGRVATECFSGSRAEREAAADEDAKAGRRREAESLAEEDEIDAEIDRLFGKIEEFTAERLDVEGFHQHKRQWRRRRGARDNERGD